MRQLDLKKLLLPNLPYLLIGLYATKLGEAWRLAPGADASAKLLGLMDGFAAAFQSALPSFHPVDLLVGLCCGAALRLAVYFKGKNAKKYRKNMEYGSARWGTAEDIKPFMDPVFENKAIYKDNADTIIGNMDATVFLGGKEPTTLKELAASLGKETIDTYNTGESRGRETSHSLNYQKLGKELMSQDELAVMDGGKCILQLRGVRPFLSEKFDITKHPNYKYLSDYDKKNAFDIERFLSARLKLRPDEQFAAYSIDLSGDEAAEETGG